jgi:hypothetical protein
MAESLAHGIIKILGNANRDLLLNSIVTDGALPEEFLDSGGGYVGNRLCFNPFGEVLHYDYSESVVTLCWCMFTKDVDAPLLQGPGWGDELRRLCGSLGAMGEFLASFIG